MSEAITELYSALNYWESALDQLERYSVKTNDNLYDYIKSDRVALRKAKEAYKRLAQYD